VARPIFFATLIIITAYFPLFTLQRGEAALFTPMAYTVGFALFGALLCTLALVPGLAYLAFRKPRRSFHNRPLEWLGSAYRTALGRLLNWPMLSFAAGALAFVGVGVLGMNVGRDYLPDLDEGSLWLQVQMPSGLSLDAASEMASELRRAVREFPEVRYIMTQLGREDAAVDAWTPSHIEAPIGLTPYETWPKGETKADFVRKLNARLRELPGFDVGINQPISDMVFDLVGGAHSALVIRLFGDDFAEDRRIAGEIVDLLRNIRGTAEASIFQEPPLPQIVIETDTRRRGHWRLGTVPAGADDRDSRHDRNDAGGARNGRGQRRSARGGDGRDRRPHSRDAAHVVHRAELLLFDRTDCRALVGLAPDGFHGNPGRVVRPAVA
jgi:cobalt-zinc-cadmium resistance protein CzcA